ncbi:hypothetical protein [Mediannikoviicoccus vaginalis]|uniref:hypothetical protein n=1 Tax=Mediannikoviicoccus vaginalis TaxID=2899727 RepID=UPI001F2E51FD|nr:hypothetical protein [Mediannikoviicoccus vaginalis]
MLNKNVKFEIELYKPMCKWLGVYLNDKYKNKDCTIIIEDSHAVDLDSVLNKHDVIKYYPQAVGLNIQIDVLGIVKESDKAEIYFIEAKKTALNLHDLGQLLIYCKLCNPEEAYLLSSSGLGSLNKILNNLNREDLLDYGSGRRIKKIKVARWDIAKNGIDNHSIVPKI